MTTRRTALLDKLLKPIAFFLMYPRSYRQNLSAAPYEFSYTPILIKFVPAVVVEGSSSFDIDQMPSRLVIHSPSSRLPGMEQSLSRRTVVPIPANGLLKLKLVPSDLYAPDGVYKVAVYSKGSDIVLDQMSWIVPHCLSECTVDLIRGTEDRDSLNIKDLYEITNVSYPGTYSIEGNSIVWEDSSIKVGDRYSVTYQPAVNLNSLIVDRPK